LAPAGCPRPLAAARPRAGGVRRAAMSDSQWNVKVKIETLDRGGVPTKNMWTQGAVVTVQIEPHATINMMKQRVAILVAAHMKHQTITTEANVEIDDLKKLNEVEGLVDGGTLLLHVRQPKEEEAPPVEISDDDGVWPEGEAAVEPLPEGDAMTKELTDEEMDKQNQLKGELAELLEDGKKEEALAKCTEAILVGNPSAMQLAKRAELLLKMKRPKAAISDATAALAKNPDSGKAYRIRGKARRFVGEYEAAKADLDQAQRMDYDDDTADIHSYVSKRAAKLALKAAQDAKKAEAEAAEAAAP